ncbi:Type II secretion system (T2SS), protein F [uncultured archaeon]|nr:Type II secretion system (T2SS), protein F [uncultured archaeon]
MAGTISGNSLMKKYAGYLHTAEFRVEPMAWIGLSLVAALVAGTGTWAISEFALGLGQSIPIGAMFFIVLADIMIGYPYLMAQQKIDRIEEDLPDALRQIADTLKAGGTFEYALREVVNSEYGPLKKELNEALRMLEEGQNFKDALQTVYHNIDSRLVKRTITIIIDSVSAGASLTGILDEIAEDVRASHRIDKERKSKTLMQVLFMFAAGGIIAPIIFGFTSTIAGILTSATGGAATPEMMKSATEAIGIIQNSIQFYLFAEVFFTSLMISLIRDGRLTKSIIYFPLLLFMAYLSYLMAIIVSSAIVGGIK